MSNAAKNTRMAFKDQINQNVGFFIYNRFQIIPGETMLKNL